MFLAGGITGCPDWQSTIAELLTDTDLVLLNPRRPDFPIGDKSAAYQQILWEFMHLRKAERILFWFPAENAAGCPIALYELGAWLMTDKPVVVGVEPGYVREEDVVIQTQLQRPNIVVVDSLFDLAEAVRQDLY